ncbi:MAG: hypothetical protein IJA44_06560 [Clostridia bacterium]|nr:hypothetical protein [Clostridia bacterium]
MLKKILISVVALIVMLTTVVSAIEIGDDFYLYGRDDKKLANALSMTEEEVKSYCQENGINLLAVNSDNTKQIREITRETEFSKTVKNLAVLKNDEILALTYQLCGLENVKGKVIEKDAYKYLKIEVSGKDSGGEYILTQYITVKNSKTVTLSFYTSKGKDTSYTDKIFNSQFSNITATKGWLTVALAFLLGLSAVLSVMIVRDLKPPKREEENNEA